MKRFFGLAALLLAMAGCKHVGGKCDCGPHPGDAATYAPYSQVPHSNPVVNAQAAPLPNGKPLYETLTPPKN